MKVSAKRICFLIAAAVVILIGAAALPEGAYASEWHSFRGNPENNGLVDYATPTEQQLTEPAWVKSFSEGANGMNGWDYTPNMPLILNGDVITMSSKKLIRIDADTGDVKQESAADEVLPARANWGNTPMTYAEDNGRGLIFCPLAGGHVSCVDASTFKILWDFSVHDTLGTNSNQSLSGVVYSDGIAYTGFYSGYTALNYYVAIAVHDMTLPDPETGKDKEYKAGDLIWSFGEKGGFYFNGGVAVGDAIIVGTQDGEANNDVTGISGLGLADSAIIAFDKKTGKQISNILLTDASDICSSIVHEKPENGNTGHIYWTSCGGFIFSADVDETTGEISNVKQGQIPGDGALTISTPVLYKDRLYIGYKTKKSYGSFAAYDRNTLQEIYSIEMRGYPKTSPLITTAYEQETGYLYAYLAYYETPGGLQVVRFKADATDASDESQVKVSDLFEANGYEQYGIASVVADDKGQLYYKNDSNTIFAIRKGPKVELAKVTGLKAKASGRKVTISMKNTANATGYRVLYRLNNTGAFKKEAFDAAKGTITVPNGSVVSVRARAEHVDAAKTAYGDYSDDVTVYAAESTIKKVKAAKKGFTVKYDKHKNADGYQIQYSLKKSMKSAKKTAVKKAAKVSAKVGKLKAKKQYFVRVRSYKKVDGKTLYGKWSIIKKVKTK